MKPCYECSSTILVEQYEDKNLCERCIFWYDYDALDDNVDYIDPYEDEDEEE